MHYFMGRKKQSQLVVPWCTYTSPELARDGLSLNEAGDRNVEIETFTQPFSGIDRAVLGDNSEGIRPNAPKKGTDQIVGATIVSENAGELISQISLAMTNRIEKKRSNNLPLSNTRRSDPKTR